MNDASTGTKLLALAVVPRQHQSEGATLASDGRCSTRSRDEVVDEVCTRIATGESVRAIFRNCGQGYPSHSRFWSWIGRYPDVRTRFDRALIIRCETYAEEIIELADERPPIVDDRVDLAWVNWQAKRINARQWIASRLLPQKYGDRAILAGDLNPPEGLTASIVPNLHKLSKDEKQVLLRLLHKLSGQEVEPIAVEGQALVGDGDDGAASRHR